jgi:hypothetical protein
VTGYIHKRHLFGVTHTPYGAHHPERA